MNEDITQQTEPVRRTFFDVLRDNMRIAKRVTFIHRLVYIGEHTFREHHGSGLGDCIEKTVCKVNDEYHDEPLSGLLLVYPRYFCHIIEGSEDSLFKHLHILTTIDQYARYLGRMKLLVSYHHCNQRFLPGWVAITGKPPTLLERIDVNSDLYRSSRYVYHCVQKLYKLALSQRSKLSRACASPNKVPDTESAASTATSADSRATASRPRKTNLPFVREKYTAYLPEYGLLDFLLSTVFTQDLKVYINLYGILPPLDAYKDKVWPVPTEFVPFNIFDKPYDPVTDLPTAEKPEEGADVFQDTE